MKTCFYRYKYYSSQKEKKITGKTACVIHFLN